MDSNGEIRYMNPKDLIPWERNPRKHNMPQLRASIERFGFRNVIIVNERTNTIEAGHGRAQAAVELGITSVPVLFVDDDDSTAAAYAIADNRQTEIGGWDELALLPLLQELKLEGDDAMVGLGYSDLDIADLLRRVSPSESTSSGLTNAEKLDIYNEGTIRQIILYYSPDQYEDLRVRMRVIMAELSIQTNSDVLTALVSHYESTR